MDDLNDWIGCLGGHPQSITPNLDRLAASGVLFTNAHCPAPACNPCRSAVFTGKAPNRSGLYDNRQNMREVMPTEPIIPKYLREHGYYAAGSGKLLHYFIDARSWDEYFPKAESENPFPATFYPQQRPVNLKRGGPWQYVETDWAALDVTDEEFGGDWSVSQWIGEQLGKEHDQPFFLGCGLYRPHEPWFVPKKYFEPFPLESIQLPPGYLENDLDDVPKAGQQAARNRYFQHILAEDQWKQGIQGYLASIHFADAMLGRVLDALESGPNAKNTIVVLWSDHGWQLGEKEHWQKYTPWRAVTRVPLMIRVPEQTSDALPSGTQAGTVCDAPVNLLSLFPTLLDLCKLPPNPNSDGPSLLPLLTDPAASDWEHDSVTFLSKPNTYAISGRTHRYIHYADGGEELYDIRKDPYEWTNLAGDPASQQQLVQFRRTGPSEFAERIEPSIQSLGRLAWHPATTGAVPPSKPDGNPFPVHFRNQQRQAVELFWRSPSGEQKSYGMIEPGRTKTQATRPGAVWAIANANGNQTLGHFVIGDRTAQAVIPANQPNIIFMMADDLGYGDLGCYGQQVIQTPRLDQMAAEGMKFTDFYAGNTVCAPSRAVLMTGMHMGHVHVRGNAGGPDMSKQTLRDEDITVAEVLKAAGYRTGISGKWGLGDFAPGGESGLPANQGFDFSYGYLNQVHAHNYYPEFLWRGDVKESLQNVVQRADRAYGGFTGGWATTKVDYSHDLIASEAIDFIKRYGTEDSKAPFFLYLSMTIPHANNESGRALGNGQEVPDFRQYEDKDWSDPNKGQAAMISRMDRDIGRILDLLDTLNIAEETIVMFTSDNGPHNEGGHTPELFNPAGPLRGMKRALYEGGIRVPLIVRWPGTTPAGTTSDHIGYFGDVMATLAELASVDAPANLDSISFVPTITGKPQAQQQHPYLYWEFYEQGGRQAVRAGNWKAVRQPWMTGPTELYDLSNDIGEENNLADTHPEVVERLEAMMAEAHVEHPNWEPRGASKPRADQKPRVNQN
ncbi:sulfatase-like hydrolase/transferase [Planctomycetaceae bacterium SH139]